MEVTYHWHNLEPSDAIKDFAAKKVEKLSTHFNTMFSAIVRFRVEKVHHFVEFTLNGDGTQFIASEENQDVYAAMDLLEKKLERQVRRQKERHLGKNYRSNE